MNKRLYFVDETRGLAMLIVVSWHTLGIHSPWTDSWVMPIFFFIMGLFYKQDISLKHVMEKKFNSLLVPLIFCSIPALIISLLQHGGIATLKTLANPYQNINGCSWFLVCTYFCYVIYWAINRVVSNSKQRALLSLAVSLIGFYSSQMYLMGHRIVLPFFISTALTMIFVIEMGRMAKKYVLSENNGGGYLQLLLLALLFVSMTIAFPPKPQNMIWSEYGTHNYVLYMSYCVVGSACVILLCRRIDYVLRWSAVIGRLSMLLLILHMYIHQMLKVIIDNDICLYLLTVVLTVAIAYMIDKYLPVVTGKKPILKSDRNRI